MSDNDVQELLKLNKQLLDSIDHKDWNTYTSLCDEELTCFEPEAQGHLVTGMDFHRFYFDMNPTGRPRQSTISSPMVSIMGDVALVTYIRVVQSIDEHGHDHSASFEESRVWQKQEGEWQHVHFHRSAI
ncbi:DUF4440 domain-containing protein [Gimesia panareensis]|uniref:Calcium/calmodulin dependent protein kinase II Association n=1 Tax=Gimesia panareensis TaxID=2527978 RepID=A0A518FK04_9PLAN|nr:DUF4440 domain-containing protein [Gimesia panareensis]QDT27105.1 Calcium/calmodulin dependent protein kinase II Association [Gimesia panareensis]QDU50048.1 Calcium/calmodulin dependent protein kinase II Association [Gimesia panareensis]QDV16667.1 Calcium/calmodulin dependent protein kinase II Association [Gimesia panareensis]